MSALATVNAYAAAKSKADIETALKYCTDDVVIETYAFQVASVGQAETKDQWEAFFALFPDYTVRVDGSIEDQDRAVAWGTISATMSADIGTVASTGRAFTVPFSCVWDIRDGLIAKEQFYFDLNHICEQLGVSTEEVATVLHTVADMYEDRRVSA